MKFCHDPFVVIKTYYTAGKSDTGEKVQEKGKYKSNANPFFTELFCLEKTNIKLFLLREK